MTDPRTVKRLKGNHLSRPDPLAWLLLADHFEESGDDASAKLWRRRAEFFAHLQTMFTMQQEGAYCCLVRNPQGGLGVRFAWEGVYQGKCLVQVWRKKKTFLVGLGAVVPEPIKSNLWRIGNVSPAYHTTRILRLIDQIQET